MKLFESRNNISIYDCDAYLIRCLSREKNDI